MAVTATFTQDPIEVVPGSPVALTLRLHNDGLRVREVTLEPAGALAHLLKIVTASATMETNQIIDVVVEVDMPSTFEPGAHGIAVQVASLAVTDDTTPVAGIARGPDPTSEGGLGVADIPPTTPPGELAPAPETLTVSATVNVATNSAFGVELRPHRSSGSTSGRHRVRVVNVGNVAVTIAMEADEPDPAITIALAASVLTVEPGATGEATVTAATKDPYWSGPKVAYDFVVRTSASDGSTEELAGSFEQRPRLPNWVGPAAAGAFAALVVSAGVWFAFLRPWVEDTADQAVATAIEDDRAALQIRTDALEAAAAEAEELPLGTPTDIQLTVAPTGGNSDSASDVVGLGETLSVTDLIFQNPTGAVGMVSLLRGDEILLQSELANFRDWDLHLVAPYVFASSESITLEVDCRTPGAGGTDCPVSLSIVGFIDEAD